MPKYEKMSKSRGNVVLPEEVVYGVQKVHDGYSFKIPYIKDEKVWMLPLDYKAVGVWQDCLNTKQFFTATRFGRIPVFLCQDDDPRPIVLLIEEDNKQLIQHPDHPAWNLAED